jgi:hypothetical protein
MAEARLDEVLSSPRASEEEVAGEILATLSEMGVTVEATAEGKVRFKPQSVVGSRLRKLIRQYKPALITLITLLTERDSFSSRVARNTSTPSSLSSLTTDKADIYRENHRDDTRDDTRDDAVGVSSLPSPLRVARERSSERGLVAKWSREFGFISIHDPITGEWHDIQTEDATDWMKREARKRKELYKAGDKGAYNLSRAQMEEVWESEKPEMWEHPYQNDRGVIYEDYADEDGLDWKQQ